MSEIKNQEIAELSEEELGEVSGGKIKMVTTVRCRICGANITGTIGNSEIGLCSKCLKSNSSTSNS